MSTIGFHPSHPEDRKAARMPFPLHPIHAAASRAAISLPNDGHDTRALHTISAIRHLPSTPSDTPSFHPTGSGTSGDISVAGRMRLMLLAGSALGASRHRNLCPLASVPFGGQVIRHGPPPPFVETKNQLRPSQKCRAFFHSGAMRRRGRLLVARQGLPRPARQAGARTGWPLGEASTLPSAAPDYAAIGLLWPSRNVDWGAASETLHSGGKSVSKCGRTPAMDAG